MKRQVTSIIVGLLGFVVVLSLTCRAWALRKHQPWDVTTRAEPDTEAGGWFINLGITGARAKIQLDAPKILEVTYVFEDTPAFGSLKVGDKIIAANGKPFDEGHKFGYGPDFFGYEGPMMDFGNALEESQSKLGGKLTVVVIRGEEETEVVIELPSKYGALSETYPYDCPKTEIILDELYAYLLKTQKPDGTWHGRPHINAFAALALLASGDVAHLPAAKRAAEACARETNDQIEYRGLDCWKYGLYGTYLGEYYLITREEWVLEELDEINRWLHKAQMANGGWGHRPANRPGGNGYGAINVITMQAKMAWALIERCGLEADAERYKAAHDFVARGTNDIGYVWYKDGGRNNPSYADMGRTGASAIAHYLKPYWRRSLQGLCQTERQLHRQPSEDVPRYARLALAGYGLDRAWRAARSCHVSQADGLQPLALCPGSMSGWHLLLSAQPRQQSTGLRRRPTIVRFGRHGPDSLGQTPAASDDRSQAGDVLKVIKASGR